MRETDRDLLRIQHMIESINRVNEFMAGKSEKDLENNSMLFYAVVKNIEIIGEAAYKLTHEFTDSYPDIPWKQIIRMRHILVHGYYQINTEQLYNVYTEDLPYLYDKLQNLS